MKEFQYISILIFFIHYVQGDTNCYECDSRNHPECGKTFGYNEHQAQMNGLIKKCDSGHSCRKSEINMYKDKFVVRECAESAKMGCRELMKDESIVCDCVGALCNGQGVVKAYLGTLISVLIMLTL